MPHCGPLPSGGEKTVEFLRVTGIDFRLDPSGAGSNNGTRQEWMSNVLQDPVGHGLHLYESYKP